MACSKQGFCEHLWKSLVTCHCARLVAGPLLATSYALVIEDRSSNGWLPLAKFLCQDVPGPSQFVGPSFVCARGTYGSRVQLGHAVEGWTHVHSLMGLMGQFCNHEQTAGPTKQVKIVELVCFYRM